METLALLVTIIFLGLYLITFGIEIAILIWIINHFFQKYGGYWYFIWIPLMVLFNWFFVVILVKTVSRT